MDGFLRTALEEARLGLQEGGIPIGSVLVYQDRILGRGHNRRQQAGSVVLHAEMDALERAGRRTASGVSRVHAVYDALALRDVQRGGTALRNPQGRDRRESNFRGRGGSTADPGVVIEVVQDPACERLLADFIRRHPALWNEDIGR